LPPDGFRYTKGTPKQFKRSDLEQPVTREFCAECGTHLVYAAAGIVVRDRESRQRSMIQACSAGRRWRSTRWTSSRFI
jgi:hypothetical protein